MSLQFSFTPKYPKGDFRHLQAFPMIATKAPLGVWGEKHNILWVALHKCVAEYYIRATNPPPGASLIVKTSVGDTDCSFRSILVLISLSS